MTRTNPTGLIIPPASALDYPINPMPSMIDDEFAHYSLAGAEMRHSAIADMLPFNVRRGVVVVEDFQNSSGWAGGLTASVTGGSVSTEPAWIDTRPPAIGLVVLSTGGTATGRAAVVGGNLNNFTLGYGKFFCRTILATSGASTAANTFTVRVGIGSTNSGESANFVGFRYTHSVNGGNWQAVCRNNSVESFANSTVAYDRFAPFRLEFLVNADATRVDFFIDGVGVGVAPITTNIPKGNLRSVGYMPCQLLKSVGATPAQLILDAYAAVYELTTLR